MKEQFIHITSAGNKFCYSDREMTKFHREDGPAIEWADGDKTWFRDGRYHREDGPAIEYVNGYKAWYIDGVYFTEAQFNERMNPVELTLEEIAEKFGVSVDKLKIKK